ncbi:hypothetical protein SUGI_0992870 [Cryptomeria japonica]|nr:hypothetical protein SUGI_0992870 [Cryptomeria japonica]
MVDMGSSCFCTAICPSLRHGHLLSDTKSPHRRTLTVGSNNDGVKVVSTLADMQRLTINDYHCTVASFSLTKILPWDACPLLDLIPMESPFVNERIP